MRGSILRGRKREARFTTTVPRAWRRTRSPVGLRLDRIETDEKGRTVISGSCIHLSRRGKGAKRFAGFVAIAKAS